MNNLHYNALEFQGIEISTVRRAELLNWLSVIDAQEISTALANANKLILTPASADASFRRYFRLRAADQSWVIMDAPISLESTEPFIRIAALLKQACANVPTIHAWDQSLGFLLLQDFGDVTYLARRLDLSPQDAHFIADKQASALPMSNADIETSSDRVQVMYRQAIDTLLHVQSRAQPDGLQRYDVELLQTEMELFRYWLVLRHLGCSWSIADERAWQDTQQALIDDALAQEQVVVHRDYHSRNLMVVDAHNPGVLDFQDAVVGPIFYDVASLLKDCYACFDQSNLDRLLTYYFDGLSQTTLITKDNALSRRLFHSIGIQRHLKAAGIFARLWHRDGKASYLADIPRTLNYIKEAASADARFDWLASFIHYRVLPALTVMKRQQ